jgi:1-acyl-sn-glycerol-3-phosphate acyltransferase
LAVANHTCWWDPMMAMELSASQAGLETFAMMDAANLRRLRFFALVGAFGVELGSRRDGARAIRYGASLLREAGRVVWVFPQGGERPVHEPLRFLGGAARMAELAGAAVVPVGFRYAFSSTPQPRALASIGSALPDGLTGAAAITAQQDAVAAELATIDRHLARRDSAFETIHHADPGWVDAFLTRALDRFAGAVLDSADEQTAFAEPKRPLSPPDLRGAEGPGERGQ